MSATLKLYGVPLSQPFRSVAWTLLQRHASFEVVLTVPGMKSKIGSLNESFVSKTKGRTGQVPLLEFFDTSSNTSYCVSESPAILVHLCEKWISTHQSSTDWLYDKPGTKRKALIDSYMSWHHRGTRELAKLVRPLIRPDLKVDTTYEDKGNARRVLESLDTGWLHGDDVFIGGGDQPSIADMLAYEEVAQASMTGLLLKDELENDFPNLSRWMSSMEKVPYHDEIHTSLRVLGDLKPAGPDDETPIAKRLGAATKAGLLAIKEAQQSYTGSKL